MWHKKFRRMLPLLLYGELGAGEERRINRHLQTCKECRRELQELQLLHRTLEERPVLEPSSEMMSEFRSSLMKRLREEFTTAVETSREAEFRLSRGGGFFRNPRLMLGSSAALASLFLGLVVGYFLFSEGTHPLVGSQKSGGEASQQAAYFQNRGKVQIRNVRFVSSPGSEGEIEFSFDAVEPVHMKGSLQDDRIRKVLAVAMLNEKNPGVRIRAIGTLEKREAGEMDPALESALITSLKFDENAGVRKRAMEVLAKMAYTQRIKDAFLYVLAHDGNPGLRVGAINFLEAISLEGKRLGPSTTDVLEKTTRSDPNDYIRIRSAAMLREVNSND